MSRRYDPQTIEVKWQQRWEAEDLFRAVEDRSRRKYYCLEMLPYPSGRIHMGHVRNYTIGDVIARYKWMCGYNVLHPMGWDAFGMPAENAAIKQEIPPGRWTAANIAAMRTQLKRLGFSYDWAREVDTSSPDYYRWEQWIFTKMYAAGLAFRKNANVNWCDRCRTVLANEQAEGGVCWRCDGPVVLRAMEQWFLRFPDYAEALLRDLEQLTGWPERVRVMQREWIGRSEGALIRFPLEPLKTGGATVTDAIEIFTTRPDTLFGVTFMSLAWEHPLVDTLTRGTPHEAKVSEFVRKAAAVNHEARLSGNYEKAGVFTGAYCRHPITDANIPIYVANFVVMGYGTGAVMAVPAHDQRDFEFARAYRLPIRVVIQPEGDLLDPATMTAAHEGEGRMIASGQFDGLASDEGKTAIVKQLESKGLGHKTVTYKLKDWCVSRQRYWGAPIPIVYCDACGTIPVPEANLPVVLPTDVPLTGEGGSPLAKLESFVKTTCPRCGKGARRETDTMDTFVESSWYFLRYCSPSAAGGPADSGEVNYWMPIDHYIGGIEHAVGHLLYCRFFMKVLRDLGIIQFSETNEPAERLLTQGMVVKDGAKMSKSKGNVVDPDDLIAKYGADTARLFVLFAAPPERDLEWSAQGVEGMSRFLNRVWRFVDGWVETSVDVKGTEAASNDAECRLIHRTIRRVTDDIERLHFNTALSALMEYLNAVQGERCSRDAVELLPRLLAPFAPHLADELWEMCGHAECIATVTWPSADPKWLQEEMSCVVVQVNGKLRDRIMIPAESPEATVKESALTEKVRTVIGNRPVIKAICVPGKLINFVVKE